MASRSALRIVRETDAGLVICGKIGMHTSPAYAEDVYVGSVSGLRIGERHATFIVGVGAPGVTTVCRKPAARHASPFASPLSSRCSTRWAQAFSTTSGRSAPTR